MRFATYISIVSGLRQRYSGCELELDDYNAREKYITGT